MSEEEEPPPQHVQASGQPGGAEASDEEDEEVLFREAEGGQQTGGLTIDTRESDSEASEQDSSEPGRFIGSLKSIGDTYGFIVCRQTKEQYGRDVYIAKQDIPEAAEVGQALSFRVVLNDKGRPQARDVQEEESVPEECLDETPGPLPAKSQSAPAATGLTLDSPAMKTPKQEAPRSTELKPLTSPSSPWADIVDDDDEGGLLEDSQPMSSFVPPASDEVAPPEEKSRPSALKSPATLSLTSPASAPGKSPGLQYGKAPPIFVDEEDDDDELGEWGRRRRMLAPGGEKTPGAGEVSNSRLPLTAEEEEEEEDDDQLQSGFRAVDRASSSRSVPEGASAPTQKRMEPGPKGLLKRLMGSGRAQPAQEEKRPAKTVGERPPWLPAPREGGRAVPERRAPAVGLPLGAPPSASTAGGPRWGSSSAEDAIDEEGYDQQEPSPSGEGSQDDEGTGHWRRGRGVDGGWRNRSESAPDTWRNEAAAENWNSSGAPEADGNWRNSNRAVMNRMERWQSKSQYEEASERAQMEAPQPSASASSCAGDRQHEAVPLGERLYLPEALWSRTDVVRALCFKRSRRFLLSVESELMRLLQAPEGAVLRLPPLAPHYRRLLRCLCKRFRTREEKADFSDNSEIVVSTTNASFAPLLPLAAFIPKSWAGSNPSTWEDRRRDPWMMRGRSLTPCPGLVVPSKCDLSEFAPGAPGDDLGNLGSFGASGRYNVREQEQEQLRLQLLPRQWRFMEPPASQDDDGVVVTFALDVASSGEGVGVAFCEASSGAAAQEPLARLLAGLHGEPQRSSRAANFHALLVQPSPQGPSQSGTPRWCLKLGHGEQAVNGEWVDTRTVSSADEEFQGSPSSSSSSSTFWLATYPGGASGSGFAGADDEGMFVEAGIGRFPWGRVFRTRVHRRGALRKVAIGALGRDQTSVLPAISLESSICPDLASRDHLVKLSCTKRSGSAADRTPWWLQQGKQGLVAMLEGLAVCESSSAASHLQKRATDSSGGTWQALSLAENSIEEAYGGDSGALRQRQRAKAVIALGRQTALDLGLDDWAAIAEAAEAESGQSPAKASKKPLLPAPPTIAPPPPPTEGAWDQHPSQQPISPQWDQQQQQQSRQWSVSQQWDQPWSQSPSQSQAQPQWEQWRQQSPQPQMMQPATSQQTQQPWEQQQQQWEQQWEPPASPAQMEMRSSPQLSAAAPSFKPESPAANQAQVWGDSQSKPAGGADSSFSGLSASAPAFTPGSPPATQEYSGVGGVDYSSAEMYGYDGWAYSEETGWYQYANSYQDGYQEGYQENDKQKELTAGGSLSSNALPFIPGEGAAAAASSMMSANAQEFSPSGAQASNSTHAVMQGGTDDWIWGSDGMAKEHGWPGEMSDGKGGQGGCGKMGKGWRGWESEFASGKGWDGGKDWDGAASSSQGWDGGVKAKGWEGAGAMKGKGWEAMKGKAWDGKGWDKGSKGWEGAKGKGWESGMPGKGKDGGGPPGKGWDVSWDGKGWEGGKGKDSLGKAWDGKGKDAGSMGKGWDGAKGKDGPSQMAKGSWEGKGWQGEAWGKSASGKGWQGDLKGGWDSGKGPGSPDRGPASEADLDWDDHRGKRGKGRHDVSNGEERRWDDGWDDKWDDRWRGSWEEEWRSEWRGAEDGKGSGWNDWQQERRQGQANAQQSQSQRGQRTRGGQNRESKSSAEKGAKAAQKGESGTNGAASRRPPMRRRETASSGSEAEEVFSSGSSSGGRPAERRGKGGRRARPQSPPASADSLSEDEEGNRPGRRDGKSRGRGRGRFGKGEGAAGGDGDSAPPPRSKLRQMWQQEREAERRQRRGDAERESDDDEAGGSKASVDIDKSALRRHLGIGS
eukprot:TRINITY_DN9694_c0_g1_i2.p1 TRINITY_DN9694_c0_g1~~TRINITY_DN9694_c0_g1_i2.p1  ORF type:complete len:1842 (+),score=466.01 TRINITY_DN9694_c0_g1_i2:81-5606(+)